MALFKKNKSEQQLPSRRRRPDSVVRTSAKTNDRQHVFARNRTLSGSTSSRLNETNYRSDLQSPRSHVHHLALRRRKIGLVFFVVLGIATFLAFFLWQFTAAVTISVDDTTLSKKINDQTYVKAINDYLGIHPFSRFRFALSTADLGNYLETALPEVASVTTVSFKGIGETHINLAMRQPVAGWTINNKQYFVDANGMAFEQNYFVTPSVEIVDNSGVSLHQGTTVASNRFLGFVGRIVALSKDRGYTVTQAIIPVGTLRELVMVLQGITTQVKLSIDRGAGEQVEDMNHALVYLNSHGLTPSYIDVRVSGKAYYK
jgi:hypothetical protein